MDDGDDPVRYLDSRCVPGAITQARVRGSVLVGVSAHPCWVVTGYNFGARARVLRSVLVRVSAPPVLGAGVGCWCWYWLLVLVLVLALVLALVVVVLPASRPLRMITPGKASADPHQTLSRVVNCDAGLSDSENTNP